MGGMFKYFAAGIKDSLKSTLQPGLLMNIQASVMYI
jgi:hypothetical protein